MIFGCAQQWLKELEEQEEVCDVAEYFQSDVVLPEEPETPAVQHSAPSAGEILKQFGVSIVYVTSINEASKYVQHLCGIREVLGIDIETYPNEVGRAENLSSVIKKKVGLDPHLSEIRLLQVYAGNGSVYVFDLKGINDRTVFNPLMERSLVAHNALFELKHLMHSGWSPSRLGCTLLQANLLRGGMWSLADLAAEVLGLNISKGLQVSNWGQEELTQEQLEYAALDAVLAKNLCDVQLPLLQKTGLVRAYNLMRDTQHAIARLELSGVYFHKELHTYLITEWRQTQEELLRELQHVFGPDLNPRSSKQLDEWLRENLDNPMLDIWPKTVKERLKTDASSLALFDDLPFVKPLLAYKEVSKNLNTYGETYAAHISPVTGRIHASFRLGGAATGRLACSSPNIQNPPRNAAFRALFCAPPGRKLVVADYSQIELRVAALVAQEQRMLEAYAKGEDLHRKTAAAVLGISEADVTKEQRQIAKAVNFGLLFGQGALGLAKFAKTKYGVSMSEEEAERARAAFFKTYPGLRRWQKQTAKEAEILLLVSTPGGRVRDFSLEKSGYKYTEALNTPIQGGAAEVLLAAMKSIEKQLKGVDAFLVNVVHDEILLEASEEDAQRSKEILEKAMLEGFLEVFPEGLPYTKGLVDAHIGNNWAEAK